MKIKKKSVHVWEIAPNEQTEKTKNKGAKND